jgi:hypothetical protein
MKFKQGSKRWSQQCTISVSSAAIADKEKPVRFATSANEITRILTLI